ncbi:MAG: mevalonate kinase [Candidatus Methanomethyliaceae archaeon]|nr:mevalonate kinase [Candidatus Methanomethyliaceae archaeon]
MQITVSVPGKVTLLGEHAVVYGRPALVSAINRRIYIKAESRSDSSIKVLSPDLKLQGLSLKINGGLSDFELEAGERKTQILEPLRYILKAIEVTSGHYGKKSGANIIVQSEMPIGAGLGTSAAISVGTVAAYSVLLGYDIDLNDIARMGHATEVAVQGLASPMDTAITTYGGTLYIKPEGTKPLMERIDMPCNFASVLGYTQREETTSQILKKVKAAKDRNPQVIDLIMDAIGLLVEEARACIKKGDMKSFGSLMNINHGLLDSLGVSTKALNDMVYASRSAGALGSKMTGAGGGGCILALCPDRVREVSLAIRLAGGMPFEVSLSSPGLRIEESSHGH